jgi:hypothetical protein
MNDKPTHRAYVVGDPDLAEGKKARWTEVGAVWPHGKGGGFDVVLPDNLAVAGRIVCRPVEELDRSAA